ncbi:hypothetical protein QTA57_13140 [Fontisubflavum oceani]|uniref:hypothetical protein n=1 Tax=Fontisubflavum oceani TaxID=2978973 RepID=UPI0025B366E5|nr:hypothetical protein [Fontisubflavum oceani]WJY20759.1 hypothetical protein QTA57_13140 [Fontisubflavum oceani]
MSEPINQTPKIISVNPDDLSGWAGRLIRPLRQAGFGMMFASRFSDQSDRRYMSDAHCLLYLHHRTASVRQALERRGNVFGRVYNLITGKDHRYVILTGHVLDTVLRVAEEPRLDEFQRSGTYQVRLDVAEALLAKFADHMQKAGHLR